MNPFKTQKIYFHPARVSEWVQRGDTVPVTMELDMTNRCTDKCPCCAGGRYASTAEMDTERVDALIPELSEFGVKALIFTGGGEPLCHKHTPEAMRLACESGMDVGLITNGLLFKPEMWEHMACATWIRISLDAATPETYRYTHGTENFEKVIANIRAMVKCREATGLLSPTIGVGFLVGEKTIGEMRDCAKLCAELGVDYLQFRPFHHILKDKTLSDDIAEGYANAKLYSTESYSVVWSGHKFTHMADNDIGRPYGKCYGHSFAGVVGADGTMWLCCHTRGMNKYALGNVNYDNIFDIWFSEKREEAIKNIDFADCPPLCRCDGFNRVLWDMKHNEPDHVNFL